MRPPRTLLCILGPTAAGKTAAAVALAEAYGTAVVSADSRQIYRRMDIGTSKPTAAELARAPHHLIDICEPKETYSAAAFERDALHALAGLFHERPVAVLAGGTGFYVQALLEGSSPLPATPPAVREAVQADLANSGLPALLDELKARDPVAYARIDRQNPRRITRAVEVIRHTGRPFSSFRRGEPAERPFRSVLIGLDLPRPVLHERIARRTGAMLAAGMVAETEALLAEGFSPELPALQSIGYREAVQYLRGELAAATLPERINAATRQFARRQLTWLRKVPGIHWLPANDPAALRRYVADSLAASA